MDIKSIRDPHQGHRLGIYGTAVHDHGKMVVGDGARCHAASRLVPPPQTDPAALPRQLAQSSRAGGRLDEISVQRGAARGRRAAGARRRSGLVHGSRSRWAGEEPALAQRALLPGRGADGGWLGYVVVVDLGYSFGCDGVPGCSAKVFQIIGIKIFSFFFFFLFFFILFYILRHRGPQSSG